MLWRSRKIAVLALAFIAAPETGKQFLLFICNALLWTAADPHPHPNQPGHFLENQQSRPIPA